MPQAKGYEKAVIESYDHTDGQVFSNAKLIVPFGSEFKAGEKVDFVWFDLEQACGRLAVYALNLDDNGDLDKAAGKEFEMSVKLGRDCPAPWGIENFRFSLLEANTPEYKQIKSPSMV